TATRSPIPSAAISSNVAMFIAEPPWRTTSVGRGEGLRFSDLKGSGADRQGAHTALGAQQLQPVRLVGVALPDGGAGGVLGTSGQAGGSVVGGGHHRVATAAQVDVVSRGADHDDLGRAYRALQAGSRL